MATARHPADLPANTCECSRTTAFGVMVLASVFYATSAMHHIDNSYTAAINGQATAAIYLSRGSRALNQLRAAMGDLQLSATDEGNRRAADEIKRTRAELLDFMEQTKRALPAGRVIYR